MADTPKSVADLQTLLANNTSGAISPQDVRDFLVSALGIYGDISVFNNGTETQNNIGTTPVQLVGFDTDGNSNGCTPAQASNQITVGVAGDYRVSFHCTFFGDAGIYKFRLRKGGVEQSYGCGRKIGSSGDVGSTSFEAPAITLAASDVLTIYVESDAASGDAITMQDSAFSVRMVA